MSKELIVSATTLETKVAVVEEDQVTEIFIERRKSRGILGNIYKGRVTKVLPGMQSAFIDIGLERDAFLYVSDFVEDLEEYEKMFTDAEQAAEKLLKVEVQEDHIQPDEPRRRGRGRERGGRKGRGERPERQADTREATEPREQREPREQQEPREQREPREQQEPREQREPREPREQREPRRPREPHALRQQREGRELKMQEPAAHAGGEETTLLPALSGANFLEPARISPPPARSEKSDQPIASSEPRQTSSWLDEVREAQAALERESGGTGAGPSPRQESQPQENWEEDRDAEVRGRREIDEFSLPEDGSGSDFGNSEAPSERPDPAPARVESGTLFPPPSSQFPDSRFADSSREEIRAGDGSTTVTEAPAGEPMPGDTELPAGTPGSPDQRQRRVRRPGARRRQRGKNQHERHFSIDDLLREGQEIVVQVAKEPIAKKGARITSHIALPGRFVVFMPTVDHVGVSRRISSDKERARLKEIVTRLRGEVKRGFIVRTAGENCEEKDLRADMQYLTKLWDEIRYKGEHNSAPAVVHSELDLVPRLLRDYVSGDFKAIRVDDEAEYERIVEFVNKLDPSLVSRVKLFTKAQPIFDEFGINAEIEKALKQKVWLKSGGYIVINQTEALVAIDVNTGKFVGRGDSLEETITRTNLDAVKEVVRQIRLRDLGGIIVIDFIDMDERRNRQKVMEALERELANDRSPTKILQFNEFGLVAITRKRVKQSLERTLCQPCPYCSGTGMVKSLRTVCYSIHAEVKKLVPTLGDGDEILIRVNPEVGRALREKESGVIQEIQEMVGKDVNIKVDPLLHFEQFDIVEM